MSTASIQENLSSLFKLGTSCFDIFNLTRDCANNFSSYFKVCYYRFQVLGSEPHTGFRIVKNETENSYAYSVFLSQFLFSYTYLFYSNSILRAWDFLSHLSSPCLVSVTFFSFFWSSQTINCQILFVSFYYDCEVFYCQ